MVNPKPPAALRSPHQPGMIVVNIPHPQLLQTGCEKEEVQHASEVQLGKQIHQRRRGKNPQTNTASANGEMFYNQPRKLLIIFTICFFTNLRLRWDTWVPEGRLDCILSICIFIGISLYIYWSLLAPLLADFSVELWLPVASRWLASFDRVTDICIGKHNSIMLRSVAFMASKRRKKMEWAKLSCRCSHTACRALYVLVTKTSFQIYCLQKTAHRRITENNDNLVFLSTYCSRRIFTVDLKLLSHSRPLMPATFCSFLRKWPQRGRFPLTY